MNRRPVPVPEPSGEGVQPASERAPSATPSVGPSSAGLETLVRGLFDYAGMFPPAALDLDAALQESARAPRLLRPHLLGADLVVPYARLRDLTRERSARNGFGQTTLTACVVGVDLQLLPNAVAGVLYHNRTHGPEVRVTALEVHGTSFDAAAERALATARDQLGKVRLFVEPKWTPTEWKDGQTPILGLLGRLKASGAPVGLKVRGVGPTAIDVPTLVRLLPAVAALPVPFKATQGLHHPVLEPRHGNALGFLSLALALRLCQQGKVPAADLKRLLVEADAGRFTFVGGGAAWGKHALDAFAMRMAREDLPFTIGSCSLREPDQDLARLFGLPTKA